MLDALRNWITSLEQKCSPRKVYWCDGSAAEKAYLSDLAVRRHVFRKLNSDLWPGCYHHYTHLLDGSEADNTTYICSTRQEDAGPNLWMPAAELSEQLNRNLRGAMRGRTMHVVPFLMGPPGSASARVGVQVTDSLYLTLCLLNLATAGAPAYQQLESSPYFIRAIHSSLDLDPDRRLVAYFPEEILTISVGSSFGADALLARKNITLTVASRLAAAEGWLVGNMAVFAVENPIGEKHYFAAALPTGFGKTSLALLTPPVRFRDWRVTTVNTDAAWLRPGPDGRLYSVAPKPGYYGLLPGRDLSIEPNITELLRHDCIFTNCGTTPAGDLWWEGMGKPPPDSLYNWSGRIFDPNSRDLAAHPNSSFCAPETNNPRLDPGYAAPEGVPISAILFGSLRRSVYPPVLEALDWPHGIFLGATLSAERTGQALGPNPVRYDSFGITAFIGHPLSSYLQGWLDLESKLTDKPKIFHINWSWDAASQPDSWPNFAWNFWILHWIFGRCSGTAAAKESPLGLSPELDHIEELSRLPGSALETLAQPDPAQWRLETEARARYLSSLAIPPGIWHQWNALRR